MAGYRSFAAQTRHYFARPSQELPAAAVSGASVWRGSQLKKQPQRWRFELTDAHCRELISAIDRVRHQGLTMAKISRDNFPLPTLSQAIAGWRGAIETGPGFVVVAGLPITELASEDVALAFWGIGHHLGVPGAQNPDQELLGHVRDYAENDPTVRLYRTPHNINFHCDAAHVLSQ